MQTGHHMTEEERMFRATENGGGRTRGASGSSETGPD